MNEPCPANLDAQGRELWEQCSWIIEGGAVSPSAALQLQALAIRRELRLESERRDIYLGVVSRLRDISTRIGVARMPEDIKAELEEMANLYESWARATRQG